MLVTFKNVPKTILNPAMKGIAAMEESIKEGLWPCVNMDQNVIVEGSSLTITGQRCALWADWHGNTMQACKDAGLRPAEYQTSDKRLRWFETLESYMDSRATSEESLDYYFSRAEREGGYLFHNPKGTRIGQDPAIARYLQLGADEAAMPRIRAEFRQEELKWLERMRGFLRKEEQERLKRA